MFILKGKSSCFGILSLLAVSISAHATSITGWGLETGAQNATLTEGVAGSFSTTTPTGNAAPRADFTSVDFSSVGTTVTLSGSVVIANIFGNQQFRFGLYNNNGHALGTLNSGLWTGADNAGWLGYMIEPRNAAGTGATATVGRSGTTGAWFSGTGTYTTPTLTGLETFTGAETAAGGTFSFTLSLTRVSLTNVDISYSFIQTAGTGNYSATGAYTDAGGASATMSSFNAAGFLLNGSTGAATFSDVSVTAVPEPSTVAIGLGVVILVALRIRSRRNAFLI